MAYTTIDDPSLYFRVKTYSGSSSDGNAITWDETHANMSPNFLWLKNRTATQEHWLCDTVRGAGKFLESNSNNAESSDGASGFASFDSNGFTLNDSARTNRNTMVAWGWKESATAGFDIVTYTGNETARTISHSLSAVPKMMIVKNRGTTGNWGVYHVGLGTANKRLELDSNAAEDTGTSVWNDTDPTSSVFSVGDNDRITNGNSMTYVGYLFSEKQGFSKFAKYTGNGNADGTFVYTGFKPAWLMIKPTSINNESWKIYDNKRNTFNVSQTTLNASDYSVEGSSSGNNIDILSNGFKIRSNDSRINSSGATNIYIAFAESPFVNSNGVPNNAQ